MSDENVTGGSKQATFRKAAPARADGLTRALLACGVTGPILFILVFLVEEATRPGYNLSQTFVSLLALGPNGWVQTANFLVCGVLVLAFVVGLRRVIAGSPASVAGVIFLGLYALALIIAGIFTTDPGQGYPPGAHALSNPTAHGAVHALAGLFVFVTLTIAAISFTTRFARLEGWRGWTIYSGLTAIIVFGFFFVSVAPTGGPAGLFQRVAITVGWVWVAALAGRMLRDTQAARRT